MKRDTNYKEKSQKDFDFLIRVLDSCLTEEHIKTTRRMFSNFQTKWSEYLDTFELVELMYRFQNKYIKKTGQLNINHF